MAKKKEATATFKKIAAPTNLILGNEEEKTQEIPQEKTTPIVPIKKDKPTNTGIKSFIKEDMKRAGVTYSEEKADNILSAYDNDYDGIINDLGKQAGIKDIDAFRAKIYDIYKMPNPELTASERRGEEDDTSYIGDIGRSLAKGMTAISQGIVRIPSTIYRLAALPQNLLSNIPGLEGLEISEDSNSLVRNFLDDNQVTQYYDEAVKQRGEKLKEYSQSATEQWKSGDKIGALKTIGIQAAESIPLTALLMASGGTGAATQVGVGIGLYATGQKLHELDESNPDMNEVIKTVNAFGSGLAEWGSESMEMGSIGIGKKLLAREGKEGLRKIINSSFIQNFGSKIGVFYNIASPMVGEGLTEGASQYTENYIDLITGANPDVKMMEGVVDAFLIGTVAGGVISAPISTYNEVVTKPVMRARVKTNFKKANAQLEDIPNADYAEAIKGIVDNHQDIDKTLTNFAEVNKQYEEQTGIEDYLKARDYIVTSINFYNTNDARRRQIKQQIAEFKGDDGNVTMTIIDGQPYSIRNTKDLGKGNENKVIYIKNKDGKVKPIISSKITEWEGKSPDQIVEETISSQDMQDEMAETNEQALEEAAQRGLVEGNTVETPHGKKTLVSIAPDGTAVVEDNKGEQSVVNTNEIEPYKTKEQKETEKEEAKAPEMEGIEKGTKIVADEPLVEGSEVRVIDFDNGQGKIITPEGEQIFNTPEEREAAIQQWSEVEIETKESDIDNLPPEMAWEEMSKTNSEAANEVFVGEIDNIKAQAEELRKAAKESKSRKEQLDLYTQAQQLDTEAVRLESILNTPISTTEEVESKPKQETIEETEPAIEDTYTEIKNKRKQEISQLPTEGTRAERKARVKEVNDKYNTELSGQLHQEYLQEEENAPYNQLAPWQLEILGKKISQESFLRFSDANYITTGMTQAWFVPKADKSSINDIDALAEEISETTGVEVTPQDIVDFIVDNPNGKVRKTTDRMNEITSEYRELTGNSVKKHKAIQKTTPDAEEAPFRVAAQEQVEDIPKEKISKGAIPGVNISEKAQVDLKNSKRVVDALEKAFNIFGVPVEIINSSEIPEEVVGAAKSLTSAPKGFYYKGKAYIISNPTQKRRISSVADAVASYMHESVLHKGLDVLFETGSITLLGKTYTSKNEFLDEAFSRLDKETIASRMEIYAPNTPIEDLTDTQKRGLAEEALATLNETESPRLQVLLDKLYNFIKKITGLTSKQFTKLDLRNLLKEHRDLIIKQKEVINKGSQLEGTQVVDNSGQPMEVYHATDETFDRFDMTKRKRKSTASRNDLGFFFSPDTEFVEGWGKNIKTRTIDFKHPLSVDNKNITPEQQYVIDEIFGEKGFTGNIKQITLEKGKKLEAAGFDGIIGYEKWTDLKTKEKKTSPVYLTFGTKGIINPEGDKAMFRTEEFHTEVRKLAEQTGREYDEKIVNSYYDKNFGKGNRRGSNVKFAALDILEQLKWKDIKFRVGEQELTKEELVKSDAQILIEPKEDVKFKVEEERDKVETNPSEAQIEAGNYQKGHLQFDGFDISIENPKGSIRTGRDKDGEVWSSLLVVDYGYLKGVKGADGDNLDVFLGEDYNSDKIFVVDQVNTDRSFDETKLLVKFTDVSDAANAYLLSYEDDWDGMATIMETNKELLKEWIQNGKKSEGYETGEAWTKIYPGISSLVANERQMPKPKQQSIQVLRSKGYKNVEGVEQELQDIYRRHGEKASVYVNRQNKQQRGLQEGKLSLDNKRNSVAEQKKREEIQIQRKGNVPERMGKRVKDETTHAKSEDSRVQMEYRESPYYAFWLSTQELEDINVQGRINADGTHSKKVWDKYIRIQRENIQRLERERSGRGEDVKFRVESADPETQKLLDKLQAIKELSKTAARIKGLQEETKQLIPEERQAIQDKIEAIKEGAKLGKADTKEMIKEVQKAITDYAKKHIPLLEAGGREVGSLLTLVKDAQTPEAIEKAFDRIDELTITTKDKTERRKYTSKVNRLLNWMTGLKKSGTKRVGKFNYEDTKEFLQLKQINDDAIKWVKKINYWKTPTEEKIEAEKELDKLWDDLDNKADRNDLDNAMMKLIELRRLGAKASPKLAQVVSEELQAIYIKAKEAKSEADMAKGLVRKEEKDYIESFLDNKAAKDLPWFKKAMVDLNTKTVDFMGNWETLMTMIGGYGLRDKTSLILNEADMVTGKHETSGALLDEAQKIYNSKSKLGTLNKIHELSKEDYELRQPNRQGEEGKGEPMPLSKLHLMDIYNALKNPDVENDYYMSYGDIILAEDGSRDTEAQMADGEQRISELINNLSEQDKAFADAMQAELDKYYDILNEIYIKLYNRDLPRVENYWPSTAEREVSIDIMEQRFSESRHPSATKERNAHRTPMPQDAFNKFTKHVEESEWYANMALPIDRINKLFKDNNIKTLIKDARGQKFVNHISAAIQDVGLMPPRKTLPKNELDKMFNPLLNNWVVSKIGATPSVPLKQLLSSVNYSENMPTLQWATGFIKGVANPAKTWKEMMQIPYLKARLGDGFSEAVQRALNGDESLHRSKVVNAHQAFNRLMTIGTRYGDITAIVFGGKPYLDYLIKEGMKKEGAVKEEVEKEAVDQFLLDTLRSQQSPLSSTLSKFQNSKNMLARAVFAFSNTTSQYMRKLFESNQNLRVQRQQYKKGKITKDELQKAWKQTRKAYQIYALVNTVMFTSTGALVNAFLRGSDWDDEIWKDMLIQLEKVFIGGLPIVKDLAETATRITLGMKVYDNAEPFIEGIDEAATEGIKLLAGKSKDEAKSLERVGQGVATMLGVPYYNVKKIIKAIPPMRENTFNETRTRETEDKLNKINKGDNQIEAQAAYDIKKAYSKAKSKATKLRNEGDILKAKMIERQIMRSKVRLWGTDFNAWNMDFEKEMFEDMIK